MFQICAFREMRQERERRQTVGRGLRLCVDQNGDRIRGFAINTLTVIANESYQSFAEKLQHDIEAETDIRFGVVSQLQFATLQTQVPGDAPAVLGEAASRLLWESLRASGYLDASGKVTDALRRALKSQTVELPTASEPLREQVLPVLEKRAGGLQIKDADEKPVVIRLRDSVFESQEFRQLWDRIRSKTTYRVNFSTKQMVDECVKELRAISIAPPTVHDTTAILETTHSGIRAKSTQTFAPVRLSNTEASYPDLLSGATSKNPTPPPNACSGVARKRQLEQLPAQSHRVHPRRRGPHQSC